MSKETIKPWGIDAAFDVKPTEPWFDDFGDSDHECLSTTSPTPSKEWKDILKNADAGQVLGPISSSEMVGFTNVADGSLVVAPKTEVPPTAIESQVDGNHYCEQGVQPLEATFQNFGYAGLRASIYTKVGKYLTREKGTHRKDITKAIHCLQMQLEFFDRSTK